MIVTLNQFYPSFEDNMRILETLYQVSEAQGTPFIFRFADTCEYKFPLGMEREIRTKKFTEIIEKHRPP